MSRKITFICTGNTCRSVMAHKILEKELSDSGNTEYEVDSAGTAAMPFYAIIGDLKTVMDENEIDYSGHTPKLVDEKIIEESDEVVVMTKDHKRILLQKFPQYESRISLLSDIADKGEIDIPDPIGMGVAEYRKTYKIIKKYVEKLMEKINEQAEEN